MLRSGEGIILLTSLSFGLAASAPESALKRFEFSQIQMGTLFRLVLYAPDRGQAESAANDAFGRVEELDQILSDYRADSELARVSAAAPGGPQVASADLFTVLEKAAWFSRLSGGAFDVTVKPLTVLWKESLKKGRVPEAQDLARARAKVGHAKVLLNRQTRSVRFREPGVTLDLGAIGKGFAADEAYRSLQSKGLSRALVDAGGDLRLGAPPPGRAGWSVSIDTGGGETVKLTLAARAVATSGDTFQFVEIDGVRYSHIVDPRTGWALDTGKAVTVIAPDGLTADALATTLSVLSTAEGMSLLERFQDVEVRIEERTEKGRKVIRSGNFPSSSKAGTAL